MDFRIGNQQNLTEPVSLWNREEICSVPPYWGQDWMSLVQILEFLRVMLGRNNCGLDWKVIKVLVSWSSVGSISSYSEEIVKQSQWLRPVISFTKEASATESQSHVLHGLHSEFKATLGNLVRSYLKIMQKKKVEKTLGSIPPTRGEGGGKGTIETVLMWRWWAGWMWILLQRMLAWELL